MDAWASVLDLSDPTSLPTHEDAAVALLSLRHVQFRDCLIALLTPGTMPVEELAPDTKNLIVELAGCAPDEHATPVLTVLAAHAWAGDGALARVALTGHCDANPATSSAYTPDGRGEHHPHDR